VSSRPIRVCLGNGAPSEFSGYLTRLGLEVVSFAQRQHADLYVDFIGARPAGVPTVSLDLTARSGSEPRRGADFASDNLLAAATFVFSHALKLAPPFLTGDPDMFFCVRAAICVAASPVPVLIEGEVGSGKEMMARLIHHASGRAGKFYIVSCAALDSAGSAAAIGHESRSEPQAPSQGGLDFSRLVYGDGSPGTLFIDDVGELSKANQLILLQALVAGEAYIDAPGRVSQLRPVAATSVRLSSLVERGEFRQDLYWRINAFTLEIPALRRRQADIPILANYFLLRANPKRRISLSALRMLSHYPFPGNVRELKNLMARLAIAPLEAGGHLVDTPDVRRHLGLAALETKEDEESSAWKARREQARREMVLRTIASCGGNRAEAARRLGISLRALQYHITKAGLSKPRRRVTEALAATSPVAPEQSLKTQQLPAIEDAVGADGSPLEMDEQLLDYRLTETTGRGRTQFSTV